MNKGILIWAEVTRNKYIHPVVFELSNKAVELSEKINNAPVIGLIALEPNEIEKYKEVFILNGFDKVYYVENSTFNEYKTDLFSKISTEEIKSISPEIVLIGATNQGRDLAPRISSALHTGLTADCTALDVNEEGKLAATRPTFGGQLMATILSRTMPQMATVRPKVFKPSKQFTPGETEFIKLDICPQNIQSKIDILDFQEKICNELNIIDSAEIIVAGGRGMQSKEGFELLKKLADKVGGAVGASRVAVEMGLAPQEFQVGQTGKTVSPKLYIACGISGALQHTIGMEQSSKIIAINSDKDAPIFKIADYGYIGDAFEIIPQLIEKL